MAVRSLRDLYDEFRAANGIRDNRPGKILDEGAMSKLMQLFLAFGVQVKASDIHFEPILAGARIRYRIDGILHDMLTMSPEMRDPLVRAIKVRAGMTNDGPGRSKPQDSRFDFEAEDTISTCACPPSRRSSATSSPSASSTAPARSSSSRTWAFRPRCSRLSRR